MQFSSIKPLLPLTLVLAGSLAAQAHADSTLDRIVQAKKLRCGVMLDSPPSGYRTPDNQPEGFDVAYCKDMAKALGATAEIVETPSADRIPALVSNRIDVLVASTTSTVARGLSVAFTQPYMNYTTAVITRKDSGIKSYAELKGHTLGGVTGTSTEQMLKRDIAAWNDSKTQYTAYASDTEAFLALQQGKVDAVLQATAVAAALIKSGQFPTFELAGEAPFPPDLVSIAVRRDDQQMLGWAKLFVWNEVSSGRFGELYKQYISATELPSLRVSGVDF
ncbi:transporter substrate-binding domain-containing protein [Pseudomonas typographi]|uniref:Transporter substrate-binding domain-containing protein n=1 Tax=Pseudomonas typographi TaxID=2715964 RepID=A0ABR7Z7H4_9PSED|nr:transporter substrate-binding domain-containing protein [Pseudomonas typographi]MBD1601342.1 transporter substrate-binding domain-containing protein [Pseudomonas typographi]